MKTNLLHILAFALLSSFGLNAQTYVNQAATGANDGSSWADAYTSLNDALDNTTSGEIWVAAGTYVPAGDGINSTFLVNTQVDLYGGFAGTETSIGDRDFMANSTILSGDQNGDDVADDWVNNRADNSLHVVFVDSLLSIVKLDGFQISGGNTIDDPDVEYETRVGGGVFSYSSMDVENCLFTSNFGRTGASIAIISSVNNGGDNSSFENCSFSRNRTTSQSAGIHCNTTDGLIVNNCEFVENICVRGAVYPLNVDNATISNCSFRDNYAEAGGFGCAMFMWQPDNMVVENCEFINNVTGNGGAFYIDGREAVTTADNVIVRNCSFSNNDASGGSGGAIRGFGMSMTIENCTFEDSDASNNGGALLLNGPDTVAMEVVITDNTFTNNSGGFGGAIGLYSAMTTYTVTGNTFTRNNALTSGGSAIVAFGADVSMENNTFSQDSARFGGAIALQNAESSFYANNCTFEQLYTSDNAGAINILNGPVFLVENSVFDLNATEMFGGVVNSNISDDTEPGTLSFVNNKFYNNSAGTQAGAINISNFNVDLISNVFAFNNNFGEGAGGALSINAADSFKIDVNIINNTFSGNFAQLGAGIAGFTDGDPESVANINLQNNIFHNEDGDNYALEDGEPNLVSLGGNLVTDDTMEDFLTATNDMSDGEDPMFVDPDEFNFKLLDGSPAINIGIAAGAPTEDIDGKDRIMEPEAGAYEFDPADFIIETVVNNVGLLTIKPNPVVSDLYFEIDNHWNGQVQAQIMDLKGQIIYTTNINKTSEVQTFNTNIDEINTGVYFLVVKQNNEAVVAKLVKM